MESSANQISFAQLFDALNFPQDTKKSGLMNVEGPLSLEERKTVVNNALNTEQQDAEDMLRRTRSRYDACVVWSLICLSATLC